MFAIVYVGTYTILEKFSDIRTIKDHMLTRVTFGKIAANTKLVNIQIEEICRKQKTFTRKISLIAARNLFAFA